MLAAKSSHKFRKQKIKRNTKVTAAADTLRAVMEIICRVLSVFLVAVLFFCCARVLLALMKTPGMLIVIPVARSTRATRTRTNKASLKHFEVTSHLLLLLLEVFSLWFFFNRSVRNNNPSRSKYTKQKAHRFAQKEFIEGDKQLQIVG